jgi:quinol monooxygenase YgiN
VIKIDSTRAEPGCLKYDLQQDNKNLTHFTFYETWTSKDKLQTHLNNKHLTDYIVATQDAVEVFLLNEMTKIV